MKFRRNHAFHQQITRNAIYIEGLDKIAEHLADKTRDATPHGRGDAKRSISSEDNRVISTDPFWHLIEFGSRNNPAYAPMRRAARAAGLRLDDKQ